MQPTRSSLKVRSSFACCLFSLDALKPSTIVNILSTTFCSGSSLFHTFSRSILEPSRIVYPKKSSTNYRQITLQRSFSAPHTLSGCSSRPHTVKAVHFAGKDAVCVYKPSQRPRAVTLPFTDDSGTESEIDSASTMFGEYLSRSVRPDGSHQRTSSMLGELRDEKVTLVRERSSLVPDAPGMLHGSSLDPIPSKVRLESVHVSKSSTAPHSYSAVQTDQKLLGTALVHNICFDKSVRIRYSWDSWCTSSDIFASWDPTPTPASDWDRFAFSIDLSSVKGLSSRLLELAVQFIPLSNPNAQYWDNNNGRNYTFAFTHHRRENVPLFTTTASSPMSQTIASHHGRRPMPYFSGRSEYGDVTSVSRDRPNLRLSNYVSPIASPLAYQSHSLSNLPSSTTLGSLRISSRQSLPAVTYSQPRPSAKNAPSEFLERYCYADPVSHPPSPRFSISAL